MGHLLKLLRHHLALFNLCKNKLLDEIIKALCLHLPAHPHQKPTIVTDPLARRAVYQLGRLCAIPCLLSPDGQLDSNRSSSSLSVL